MCVYCTTPLPPVFSLLLVIVQAVLDDMCLLNNASDDGLARKYVEALKDRPRFSATPKQKALGQFVVRHYAGEVTYSTPGFIEKNRDSIHKEATEALACSDSRMVSMRVCAYACVRGHVYVCIH